MSIFAWFADMSLLKFAIYAGIFVVLVVAFLCASWYYAMSKSTDFTHAMMIQSIWFGVFLFFFLVFVFFDYTTLQLVG